MASTVPSTQRPKSRRKAPALASSRALVQSRGTRSAVRVASQCEAPLAADSGAILIGLTAHQIPSVMQNGTMLAAVDLGSNSCRLEIGRLDNGHIQRVEYLKETVRLGAGLDDEHNLSMEAMQRGWDCLARFAERLVGFSRTHVRAVATQTLREAKNRDVFLRRGTGILGFPIDLVSGPEEARLIYQGVARLLPQSDERRLVLDIGGRSTELILGRQFDAASVASYRLGSVAWSAHYFAQGQFTVRAFAQAELAAQAVLEDALATFSPGSWDVAYGASGTVGAVADILAGAGFEKDRIDRNGLAWLKAQLLRAQTADAVQLEGLKDDRRPVIGGGISVLCAVFDLLKIDTLQVAQGALRQGALYDLLSRELPSTDLRESAVQGLMQRFSVDAAQAARVRDTALALHAQLHSQRQPGDVSEGVPSARELGWAAQLHEIGCAISHADAHRHGAYILDHTDAAGFSRGELAHLGTLVLGQRGKVRKMDVDLRDTRLALQLLCLRLAAALCHARRDPQLEGLQLRHKGQRFTLSLPMGWASQFPQSAYLLEAEAAAWQKTPWDLLIAPS